MPIPLPVTKTIISSSQWGIPITNEVNRLTGLVNADAATPWTNLSLSNGWVNLGAPRASTAVKSANGMGFLRIAMKSGSFGVEAFSLPAQFRPSYYVDAQIRAQDAMCWCNFDSTGSCVLFVQSNGSNTFVGGLITYPLT